jgi:hypothetical protein
MTDRTVTGVSPVSANVVPWEESKDPLICDWKRVRRQIEHEDTLINHRMTWLWTSNSLFLVSMAGILHAIPAGATTTVSALLVVTAIFLPVAAAVACLSLMRAIKAAMAQIGTLCRWWDDRVKLAGSDPKSHPPLIGLDSQVAYRFFVAVVVPAVMALFWTFVFLYVTVVYAVLEQSEPLRSILLVLTFGIMFLAIGVYVGWRVYRTRAAV